MLFNSIEYAVFLALVVALYWVVPMRSRRPLLLVASYVFYGWWDWRLCGLLLFTTGGTFLAGRVLARVEAPAQRRLLLVYGLVPPLGTLVAFKLYGFFVSALADSATGFGLQLIGPGMQILVPVGLSFYTFQAISYVVDVYRRQQEPVASFVDYALFVSFFPHLLAGPILRARQLVPALQREPLHNDPVRVAEGLELLLLGLFKKVALADPLTSSGVGLLTGAGLGEIGDLHSARAWLGIASAVLGDFFDIAGYTDMARGSAKLLGIDMQPNFIQPLTRSKSFADFWRRWQITVMGWFRDYVFGPLRGSNPSGRREAGALVLTFLTVGAWHSLRITWLIWGALTACVLIVETIVRRRLAERRRARRKAAARARIAAGGGGGDQAAPGPARPDWWPGAGGVRTVRNVLYVWLVLLLTVVWLGAPDVDSALDVYRLILVPSAGPVDTDGLLLFVAGIVALVLLDQRERFMYRVEGVWDPPTRWRLLGFATMVVGVVVMSGSNGQPFIYLQF